MTVGKRANGGWVPRCVVSAAAAGVVALAAAGAAGAQPPPDPCSPASVIRAHAAAMTQMADYLDAHPDVQQAFRDAWSKGTPEERQGAIRAYMDTHPEVAAAHQNIHQPVMDLSARCGLPMQEGMMPGDMTPGDMTPGDMTPGGMAPGGMTPGGMAPGGMTPGGMMPRQ
jgi:heme-binding protein